MLTADKIDNQTIHWCASVAFAILRDAGMDFDAIRTLCQEEGMRFEFPIAGIDTDNIKTAIKADILHTLRTIDEACALFSPESIHHMMAMMTGPSTRVH